MNEQEKLNLIAESMGVAGVSSDVELEEVGWDSVAAMTLVSLVRTKGHRLSVDVLKTAKTVGDLLAAI